MKQNPLFKLFFFQFLDLNQQIAKLNKARDTLETLGAQDTPRTIE